jgi:tetratricopeptide (TPR) repeat protein
MVLGLASKAMLVTLPFVFLLLDYWPLERLRFDRSARRLIMEKLPLIAVVLVFSGVTFVAQSTGGAVALGDPVPLHLRAANAVMSSGGYIWKSVWPVDLALVYPHPNLEGGTPWRAWQVAATGAFLVLVSVACLRARRQRYLAVGWLWFLGTLVPVIGLVQAGTQGMADRYTYVPCIGLYIAVAWGGAELVRRASRRRGGLRSAAALATVAAVAALALVSQRQVGYWRDTVPLFEHSLAVAKGSYMLHNNLANELFERDQLDESIQHYHATLEIKPDFLLAHRNLANALKRRGELYEGKRHYLIGRRVALDSLEGELQLGDALLREGKFEAAAARFRRAAAIDPESDTAHRSLALAVRMQSERAERDRAAEADAEPGAQ